MLEKLRQKMAKAAISRLQKAAGTELPQPTAPVPVPEKTGTEENRGIFPDADSDGFYAWSGKQLIETPQFAPLVDRISVALGGRAENFSRYLLPSITEAAQYMQLLPAAESVNGRPVQKFGHHISAGGLLLHSLETMFFALNDSRLAFFNRGVNPGRRDENLNISRIACALAGLLHDIGKIGDLIIVTYSVENGVRREHEWQCVESLPEFLCRVHGLSNLKQVFEDPEDRNAPPRPRYFIKGWKQGRSDSHEIIGPFLMRNFISRATMRLLSLGSNALLQDFMTAVNWNVITPDYTANRRNIIHDVIERADHTSCEKDRRLISTGLTPLTAGLAVRRRLSEAMWKLQEQGEAAVDKADLNCFLFTSAGNAGALKFFVLMRLDVQSESFVKRWISLASDLNGADVLQDHAPTEENILRLLTLCSFIIPSDREDGTYQIFPQCMKGMEGVTPFRAICFASWHDVMSPDSETYVLNRDVFERQTCDFSECQTPEKRLAAMPQDDCSSGSLGPVDVGAVIEKDGKLVTVTELKKDRPETDEKKTEPAEETEKDAEEGGSSGELQPDEKQKDEQSAEPQPEKAAGEAETDSTQNGTENSGNGRTDEKFRTPENLQTDAENLTGGNETDEPGEDEDAADDSVDDGEEGEEEPVIFGAVDEPDVAAAPQPDADEKIRPAESSESDEVKAGEQSVPEKTENGAQNIQDPAGEEELKMFGNIALISQTLGSRSVKKNEPDLTEKPLSKMTPAMANYCKSREEFNSGAEEAMKIFLCYSRELKMPERGDEKKVRELILALTEKLSDKEAETVESMIRERLSNNFSYIDFVTPDQQNCFAVFNWNDSVIRRANSRQKLDLLRRRGLCAGLEAGDDLLRRELYYYGFIQLIPKITDIFLAAKMSPRYVSPRAHPFASLRGKPPDARTLLEYLKYRILELNPGEKLYGCPVTGFAEDLEGRRVSSSVLVSCMKEFNATGASRIKQLLTRAGQSTPPFLIKKDDMLILRYDSRMADGTIYGEKSEGGGE